jgi:glutamyl-tRNA reductase
MGIVVIGLSHRTAPVDVRERFAVPESEASTLLENLRSQGMIKEGVVLSTCNRMELYAATQDGTSEPIAPLKAFLEERAGAGPLGGKLYALGEPASLEHLFKVACGLDSMLLGETEILGQLKAAYETAKQHKHTAALLNKAFQRAFNVAKHVRTETNIQRGSVSVASAAVEMAERIFTSLGEKQVMVIGAGDTGEKTARALKSRGATGITVTNRSFDRAQALAAALGGNAVPLDRWEEVFATIDIVISSTAATDYVLDYPKLKSLLKHRKPEPLLLIDIAVPRDIDPAVNTIDDVFLYNIDDLQAIANDYLRQRQEEIARCERIIRERAAQLMEEQRKYLARTAAPEQT